MYQQNMEWKKTLKILFLIELLSFYSKIQNCMKLIQITAFKNCFELHNK